MAVELAATHMSSNRVSVGKIKRAKSECTARNNGHELLGVRLEELEAPATMMWSKWLMSCTW
jgi:hypothetical protein